MPDKQEQRACVVTKYSMDMTSHDAQINYDCIENDVLRLKCSNVSPIYRVLKQLVSTTPHRAKPQQARDCVVVEKQQ